MGQYTIGDETTEIAPGSWTAVLPARKPLKLDFKSRYRQLVLRIEFEALLGNLAALLGQEIGKEL